MKKYFKNEATISGNEITLIYCMIIEEIEREQEYINVYENPDIYNDIEESKRMITIAKKRIEELKAIQNKLLTDY